MWSAQLNKLEFIAHALGVKKGDNAMDIGAGWGCLSNLLASKGANVTGVLMASDQKAYADRMSKKLGNEHVGIRNYNKFLRKVHHLLADDGTFYLQVAGLP